MTDAPLFVLGAQRSGTTILSILLSRHPEICLTVNGKLLYYLIVWVLRERSDNFAHPRLDEILHGLSRRPIQGVSPAEIERALRALSDDPPPADAPPEAYAREAWGRFYGSFAGARPVVGDKYNEYLLQMAEIESVFPRARYVFVHRHPGEAAESAVRAFAGRPWAPLDYEGALAKWAVWNAQWLAARSRLPTSRRIEMAYADLVRDPRDAFERILRFLDVKPTDGFLDLAAAEIRAPLESRRPPAAPRGPAKEQVEAVASSLGYSTWS